MSLISQIDRWLSKAVRYDMPKRRLTLRTDWYGTLPSSVVRRINDHARDRDIRSGALVSREVRQERAAIARRLGFATCDWPHRFQPHAVSRPCAWCGCFRSEHDQRQRDARAALTAAGVAFVEAAVVR